MIVVHRNQGVILNTTPWPVSPPLLVVPYNTPAASIAKSLFGYAPHLGRVGSPSRISGALHQRFRRTRMKSRLVDLSWFLLQVRFNSLGQA